MRIVLDTNVIVTAMRSSKGASAAVLRLDLQGKVTLICSVALMLEYEEITMRSGVLLPGTSRGDVIVILDSLCQKAILPSIDFQWRPQLPDPDDELVLEAAVNGQADAIVTFNRRDFVPFASQFGVEILEPGDVLRRMQT
jgi:putative PIN family toxin of toxin-antitoxin system